MFVLPTRYLCPSCWGLLRASGGSGELVGPRARAVAYVAVAWCVGVGAVLAPGAHDRPGDAPWVGVVLVVPLHSQSTTQPSPPTSAVPGSSTPSAPSSSSSPPPSSSSVPPPSSAPASTPPSASPSPSSPPSCPLPSQPSWDSVPVSSSASLCDPASAWGQRTAEEVARLRVAVLAGLGLLLLVSTATLVARWT